MYINCHGCAKRLSRKDGGKIISIKGVPIVYCGLCIALLENKTATELLTVSLKHLGNDNIPAEVAIELAEPLIEKAIKELMEAIQWPLNNETCPLSGAPCDSLKASCRELQYCYLKS